MQEFAVMEHVLLPNAVSKKLDGGASLISGATLLILF
jgi:hypothetical protein